ncbi:BglG family transcription antiterminator [Maledivibacter halophilus]|uniref:Mannitol operon transcriptional antiterminator n=1 Tax=Maledivibacter halophilus TaxID=36842 RepID=A0A1T5IPA2_9FIRM|nr:BglG family transcription antiterminator [Maledivibacter halophilus]SKC40959.1 mannitol operon transcriptional antiterminator [Maledivibacter halophilus]
MNEKLLAFRTKQILEIINNSSETITTKEIAKKLGVSTRTVLREMHYVEKWLKSNNFQLVKKPRIGIKLIATLDDKKRLKGLLEDELVEQSFTPEERQSLIIGELLQRKEPTKLYYFSSSFKVSEGTISHDLDKIEDWFKRYELTLVRKPGLGVYLKGKEKAFRKAMINLLYENLSEDQIINVIRKSLTSINTNEGRIEINTRNRLMNLIDKEMIKIIEKTVHEAEGDLEYKLTDSSYAGLIVHLALAIQRIKNNENITMKDDLLKKLIDSHEFIIAQRISNQISKFLDIEIPQEEVGYITMHLKGSKMRNGAYKDDVKGINEFIIGNFELTKLASEMIKIAEEESGYSLKNDENLLVGLVTHFRPTIDRLKMNLDIRNPLLHKIKEMYPEIFKISKKCSEIINKRFNVIMPEAEIGFIAMHIGAAIEKKRQQEVKNKVMYRVIVACTSGIGTSKLLATRLKKEFNNLLIIDTISSLEIKEEWLKENKIDIIISTVYVDVSTIPVVSVNPLLLEKDVIKIKKTLEKINTAELRDSNINNKNHMDLRDRASALKNYGEGVLEIIDSLFLKENLDFDNHNELIKYVSTLIGESKEDIDIIERDLLAREEQGSTVLEGKRMMLLHCRTNGVNSLKFGVVRLFEEKPIFCKSGRGEEEILTVLVMMYSSSKNKGHLEVISEISRNLIDEPKFVDILAKGTKKEIFISIKSILNSFLDLKINMI